MQIGKIYKTNILFAVIYFITVLLSTLLVSLLGEINLNNLMLRTVLCFFFSILMLFISIENYKNGKQFVNKKIKSAFANGLKPIVCVGETLEQREAGKTEEIITNQTKLALEGLTNDQVQNTIVAYEPIWAIGTGKTATSEDANNSIKAIRNKIAEIYGSDVADQVIIQYGGSVKSSNAKELFSTSDIDGGLVGGASLKAEEFSKIVNYDK